MVTCPSLLDVYAVGVLLRAAPPTVAVPTAVDLVDLNDKSMLALGNGSPYWSSSVTATLGRVVDTDQIAGSLFTTTFTAFAEFASFDILLVR